MRKKSKLTRYEERQLVIGYRRTINYISIHFQDLIYYVFIPNRPSHFQKRCMKESVGATLETDPQHTGLLPKVTSGRICRGRLWNTSESVTSASGMHQAYTNQGESLIRYLTYDHLLNRVQILWDHFLKQWETRNICWLAQTILRSGSKQSL